MSTNNDSLFNIMADALNPNLINKMQQKNKEPYDFYRPKTIIELNYNYRMAVCDGREIFPEDWDTAKVGEKEVESIEEHEAHGEGDKWFFDIVKTNGDVIRIFNPCRVIYQ